MLCQVPDGTKFSVQVKGISKKGGLWIQKSFFDCPLRNDLFLVVVLVPTDETSNFRFFVLSHEEAKKEFERLPTVRKKDGKPFPPGNEGLTWGSIKGYEKAWSKFPSATASISPVSTQSA
jgi:CRISPR/Cas system-associated endoribonuclease Cas2